MTLPSLTDLGATLDNCVIEDTINHPTCSNGVLPSRTPLTSQAAAMVSCRHPSFLSLSLCRPLFPSLVLSLSHLSCRSCSRAAFALALSLINWSLSRARALTLTRRLIYICALEDTIGIPTCWNGVLQSPSVIVSSHLWLFLSFSLISLVSLSCARSRTRARPRH